MPRSHRVPHASALSWLAGVASLLAGCEASAPAVDDLSQAVAGNGDRYGCITRSRPGCDLDVGVGDSLYGAGECRPGEDFDVETRDRDPSQPLVLAIHGGGIELGTAELARHLARELGWDYYIFEAHRSSATCEQNRWMHVTSTRFNSATALDMAESHPSAVSLHGYREDDREDLPPDTDLVCVGGSNAGARRVFIERINRAALVVDGHAVLAYDATTRREPAADHCRGLRGIEPDNIANRGASGGLQLELPRHLRDGLAAAPAVRQGLVDAIAAAL